MRTIELLAPARNLECGIEAIRHGADAVYIGAPRFGARAAAGNSVEDIAQLVRFAHPFGVRIYVTLNTLLFDNELQDVQTLINQLADINVDALIVQDERIKSGTDPSDILEESSNLKKVERDIDPPPLSIVHCPSSIVHSSFDIRHSSFLKYQATKVERDIRHSSFIYSPLPLHASTQMDNRTVDDVRARQAAGYTQTVLARELSLEQIRAIHEAVPAMPLEVFIHGALCVSYSGRCYASEYCFGRSANRGECAQFCRLPFDLVDAQGHIVSDSSGRPLRQRYLLSLKDMNRADALEALMDAGVSSFKIEGRLKDVAYVKNVTAYYRQRLDAILSRRADTYLRSSYGQSELTFTPNPLRSFNRGFTDYFLYGRTRDMACHATPKAIGEPVGTVKEVRAGWLTVAGTTTFTAGDGLCFFTPDGRLEGFRVNTIDAHGRLAVNDASRLTELRPHTPLYRNQDQAFEHLLSRPTASRRLAVSWLLEDIPEGFRLTLADETGSSCARTFIYKHERARTPQTENLVRQLLRLGDTPFSTSEKAIQIRLSDQWFIPASVLAQWRRQMTDVEKNRPTPCRAGRGKRPTPNPSRQGGETSGLQGDSIAPALPSLTGARKKELSVLSGLVVGGGSSALATPLLHCPSSIVHSSFVIRHSTFDIRHSSFDILMTCRYCLRHALGQCLKEPSSLRGELFLRLSDGRLFPLSFDCQRCEMQVLRPRS